jgi:hypothetical protein
MVCEPNVGYDDCYKLVEAEQRTYDGKSEYWNEIRSDKRGFGVRFGRVDASTS